MKNLIQSEIGRNTLIARKALNLNHIEVVKRSGLTRPVISAIENGTGNPTINSILKLGSTLKVNFEMLTMTQAEFKKLSKLLKSAYNQGNLKNDIYIPNNYWNFLLKYSEENQKKYYGKIAQVCSHILKINYPDIDESILQNKIHGASLGVIFQQNGFEQGLRFGSWLGEVI